MGTAEEGEEIGHVTKDSVMMTNIYASLSVGQAVCLASNRQNSQKLYHLEREREQFSDSLKVAQLV